MTGDERIVPDPDAPTISDVVAERIRDIRKRRGLKVADLAARCQELGGSAERLTANVIENIEHGRRRDGKRTREITVDELLDIASALSVPPAALMYQLYEGPTDFPVLFGLDDVAEGLRATLGSIEELKRRLDQDKERGKETVFRDPQSSPFYAGNGDGSR